MENIHKTDNDMMKGNIEASPRFRINRSVSLNLSTVWQRIDFNGTSTYNINTYPVVNGQTYKLVDWDAVNKLFKFYAPNDRNYTVQLFYKFVGGLRPVDILYRFVIPVVVNGVPAPVYFPFPDSRQYANLTSLQSISDTGSSLDLSIYANSLIRQYGIGLEMKTAQTQVTPVGLAEAAFIVYSK